VQPENLYK